MRVRIEIVIPVWRHGREAVPTVRSLLESAEAASAVAQTSLVLAVAQSCADGLPAVVRSHARVVLIGDSDAAVLAGRGLSQSTADVVGVVEAGDLVGVDWLSAAARVARGEVIRPEFIVTFGQRTGIGRQPTSQGSTKSRGCLRTSMCGPQFSLHAPTPFGRQSPPVICAEGLSRLLLLSPRRG